MALGWGTRIFHQWSTHWYTSSEIANFTEPFATPSLSCPVFMKKMHKTFLQNQSETERYEMWVLVTTLQLRRETSEDNPREKYSCLITSLALLSHHFIAWFCTSVVGSHNHRYYFYCNSVSFRYQEIVTKKICYTMIILVWLFEIVLSYLLFFNLQQNNIKEYQQEKNLHHTRTI